MSGHTSDLGEPSKGPPPTSIPSTRRTIIISDTDAVEAIHRRLNRPGQWNPDTLNEVSQLIEATGRPIVEPDAIADIEVELMESSRDWPIAHTEVDGLLTAYVFQTSDAMIVVDLHGRDDSTSGRLRVLLDGKLIAGPPFPDADTPLPGTGATDASQQMTDAVQLVALALNTAHGEARSQHRDKEVLTRIVGAIADALYGHDTFDASGKRRRFVELCLQQVLAKGIT
ncbi:hypothetical protein GCM10009733_020830 [Nonomuraea maheshkhaliensis]|uniref:Uncharacterized protein n=1 Tax=Nonomuraea maheshkhaliensis TaxID=419590 RepID=A0ABP4QVB7_9ACTN